MTQKQKVERIQNYWMKVMSIPTCLQDGKSAVLNDKGDVCWTSHGVENRIHITPCYVSQQHKVNGKWKTDLRWDFGYALTRTYMN